MDLPSKPEGWLTTILPSSFELWKTTIRRPASGRMYHYTSAQALLNILEKREMWATNLRYTNDPAELIHARNVIEGALERAVARECESSTDVNVAAWLSSFTTVIDRHIEEEDYYSVSFCENGDLLSQWRAYGGSGGGFALGYDASEVLVDNVIPATIEYGLAEQNRLIDETISLHVAEMRTVGFLPIAEWNDYHVSLTASLGAQLTFYLYAFKHASFAEEGEFRFIYPMVSNAWKANKAVDFAFFAGSVKPFLKLDFSRLPLAEVVYGPTLDRALTAKWLKMALRRYGYADTIVRCSSVPMR